MFRVYVDLLEGNLGLGRPYFGWKKILHQNPHKAKSHRYLATTVPPFSMWVLGSVKLMQDLFIQLCTRMFMYFRQPFIDQNRLEGCLISTFPSMASLSRWLSKQGIAWWQSRSWWRCEQRNSTNSSSATVLYNPSEWPPPRTTKLKHTSNAENSSCLFTFFVF